MAQNIKSCQVFDYFQHSKPLIYFGKIIKILTNFDIFEPDFVRILLQNVIKYLVSSPIFGDSGPILIDSGPILDDSGSILWARFSVNVGPIFGQPGPDSWFAKARFSVGQGPILDD